MPDNVFGAAPGIWRKRPFLNTSIVVYFRIYEALLPVKYKPAKTAKIAARTWVAPARYALDKNGAFNSASFPIFLKQADEVWHEHRNAVRAGMAEARKKGVKFGTQRPGAQTKKFLKAKFWKLAIAESARARGTRAVDAYATLVPTIIKMRKDGEGWPAIAKFLNEEGHRTTTGAEFSAPTVLRIIQRNARHGGQGDPARREGMGRPRLHAAAH